MTKLSVPYLTATPTRTFPSYWEKDDNLREVFTLNGTLALTLPLLPSSFLPDKVNHQLVYIKMLSNRNSSYFPHQLNQHLHFLE
jgi:hypothetical protein